MDTAPGELDIPRMGVTPQRVTLWRVEVQILGLALCHVWTGLAAGSPDATLKGLEQARQLYSGRALCVRKVAQL
jgi:hypothetical protein